jgi:hypothetical protein
MSHPNNGNSHASLLLKKSQFKSKKKIPSLVRIIDKDEPTFGDQFRPANNYRFLREHNFKQISKAASDKVQASTFLILKSDLTHLRDLQEESSKMVVSDMKSVILAKQQEEKPPAPVSDDNIVSDASSVMSSASAILDSISSIFAIRSQPVPPP